MAPGTRDRRRTPTILRNLALAITVPSPFVVAESTILLGSKQRPRPLRYSGGNGTVVGWSNIVLQPHKSILFQFTFRAQPSRLQSNGVCPKGGAVSFPAVVFQYPEGADPWLPYRTRLCPTFANLAVKNVLDCSVNSNAVLPSRHKGRRRRPGS